ncbi:MAG: homocysteine S-methyltransferase family protein [Gemmatimonadales bacterium]|jgi:5-methyltetrahydrofolate--homocysteine methyltransferase
MNSPLHEAARARRLVADGAMGTALMAAGLEAGGCGEWWNVAHPERILEIQRRYVQAGADCLITNTFGGSRIMLTRHGHGELVREINRAAVRIAREAFGGGGRDGYVLGDIGPLGALLEPYGDLSEQKARAALEEQAAALVEGGADGIIIETETGLEETGLAIDAAKAAGARSVVASFAYDLSTDGSFYVTMMGVLPDRAAAFMEERGADVAALNCGTSVDMKAVAAVVRQYRAATALPIMAQPNAGNPVLVHGKVVYRQTPQEMAAAVPEVLEAGATIVGSCCGSTAEHTAAIRRAVDEFVRRHPAAGA